MDNPIMGDTMIDAQTTDQTTPVAELLVSSMIHAHTMPIRWNYVDGLGLECIYRAGKATSQDSWLDWTRRNFDNLFLQDGTIDGYDLQEYSLDQIAPGKAFFDLYLDTHQEKYRRTLDLFQSQLEQQPRTPSGGYWHKKRYPNQMWLDGLYMQGALKTRYAIMFLGDDECLAGLSDLVGQFRLIYDRTYDQKTGLLFHAWDESKRMPWADEATGCSPSIWGRALGWYAMALVDVLAYFPDRPPFYSLRNTLRELCISVAQAVIRWQDRSGLWWQVMDRGGERCNYLESSCSAMFTYFLLKLARLIPPTKQQEAPIFRNAGRRGYEGLFRDKVTKDADGYLHLHGICRGAGLGRSADSNPYRNGTFLYYCTQEPIVQDNWQGMAPLLLATLEMEDVGKITEE